ncbi:MAG TPA: SDR family NAD(P)-dependent oxidoreductase [Polyangiaceae bacterium]
MSSEASVDALVAATMTRFGRADVLVNNAGVANVKPAALETVAEFKSVLDVNLVGTFLCAQRFGRVMLDQKTGRSSRWTAAGPSSEARLEGTCRRPLYTS